MANKKEKILHKRFDDYTLEELDEIKKSKCYYCRHFKGPKDSKGYKSKKQAYIRNCMCDYLNDTGYARICRPELCPYSDAGGGIKLDQVTNEKFVNFAGYCPTCKYRDSPEFDEPCHECLANPTNYESMKPVKWEKREDNK